MEKVSLKDKKILLLAPGFFGYYDKIKKNLEEKGAEVYLIKEDFVNKSYLYRFFGVKNKKLKYFYTNNYYQNEINKIKNFVDYVFVIRGEALSQDIMSIMRKRFDKSQFIMYQWDSVRNNQNALVIQKYFDKILTFDIDDAKTFGWKYRPLFYVNCGKDKNIDKRYDFVFIGTLYYKRAILLKKIKQFCSNNKYSIFNYLYSPKLVFYIHKYILKDKRYKTVSRDEVNFKSLPINELNDIYMSSKILVDYTADDQTGLTMRTIESLGYKCKLITNNKKVMQTDIYTPENIFIYDINKFDIPLDFINSPYKDIEPEKYYYYSLDAWVEDIFNTDENIFYKV